MKLLRRLGSIYARIGRVYRAWMPTILGLSLLVFVPLGAIDALVFHLDVNALDLDSGLKIAALALAVGAVTTTGLLGEVFFSGAVAVSLTHPHGQKLPSPFEIARRLRYKRLIGVDLVYVVIVFAGMLLFIVPGVILFTFFGLAGPVVELEERTVRGALARSFRLVRGNFWFVFWVLVPIEIVGDALGEGVAGLVHGLLGHGYLASWLAESASNIVLSPIFAIAAVLLTVELIAARDGNGPAVNHAPLVTA
jgi:hypothetical protein